MLLSINLDSSVNLALYFRHRTDDFFIVSINDPSIIVGKHQIANEEINNRFVSERQIPVIRRITGGGTVYHDHGNINFTFISSGEPGTQVNFRKHTLPVTDFLASLKVDARFEGKNDIRTGGLKVSGNAEHVFKNRVLHHGTLLFNSSLSDLRDSLLMTEGQYVSRAVASNRTSVTNLINMLPDFNTPEQLKEELLRFIMQTMPATELYTPSESELSEISEISKKKYRTWEWNYAYGPAYRFINRFKFRDINHCCDLNVREGVISASRITGSALLESPGKQLTGIKHYLPDVEQYFDNLFPGEGREIAFRFF
jgi:lipoate---protein ligase